LGVLFDLLGSPSEMPWSLTVHFQGFPHELLLRCPTMETIQYHFMNTLKESECLRNGTARKVMDLSKADQTLLWDSIIKFDYDSYWKVNGNMMKEEKTRALPIRICFPDQRFIQEPLSPIPVDGQSIITLGDALRVLVPQFFDNTSGKMEQNSVPVNVVNTMFIIQGIRPPFHAPIAWLCTNCSHLDNFLYIIVQKH